jgi:hypothetical protein
VAGNLLIETQAGEAPSHEMHAQALHQLVLARHALPIADQKNAQQQLGINRWPTDFAVAVLQIFAHGRTAQDLARGRLARPKEGLVLGQPAPALYFPS